MSCDRFSDPEAVPHYGNLRGRMVRCPDCDLSYIEEGDQCDNCGLTWHDLLDAAAFIEKKP